MRTQPFIPTLPLLGSNSSARFNFKEQQQHRKFILQHNNYYPYAATLPHHPLHVPDATSKNYFVAVGGLAGLPAHEELSVLHGGDLIEWLVE